MSSRPVRRCMGVSTRMARSRRMRAPDGERSQNSPARTLALPDSSQRTSTGSLVIMRNSKRRSPTINLSSERVKDLLSLQNLPIDVVALVKDAINGNEVDIHLLICGSKFQLTAG